MNICIFIDSPLDAPGGMVQSVLNQREVLQRAGHTVYIVCIGRPLVDEDNIYYARPYFALINNDVNFAFLIDNPMTRRSIMRFLKARNIDVIHVQSEMTTSQVGIEAAHTLNIPVVLTVHNYFWPATGPLQSAGGFLVELLILMFVRQRLRLSVFGNNRLERAIRGMTELACKRVDRVIAPSSHLKQKLQDAGVKTPIDILPNPYVAIECVAAPEVLTATDRLPHFVWIGRCAPEKRLLEFIKAVVAMRQHTKASFRVTVIGAGQDLVEAQQIIHRERLEDCVTFTGRLDNERVISLIDQASFVVLTSYHFDNQPVVISEAVSRYRGVLYCDERIQEGVKHAGLRADGPSVEELVSVMLRVVEDPSLACRYSLAARQEAQMFSGDTYARQFERIVARTKEKRVV